MVRVTSLRPSSTSPRAGARRICATKGVTTVGPVAQHDRAEHRRQRAKFSPPSSGAARRPPGLGQQQAHQHRIRQAPPAVPPAGAG